MQSKECHISDIEDNNLNDEEEEEDNSDWEASSSTFYQSSSENDECSGDEHKSHYFDPTKITTSLPLLPFNNQVGGHASFFRFSKRAICKPVSAREQEFYENIDSQHHELLPFTSQYMGVLNVTYRPSSDPPVPEVLFEKNKHLLRDWRACLYNNRGEGNMRRRHSCSPSAHPKHEFIRHHSDCKARSRKFQEQVLREVFSPEAIKERLVLAEDWRRRNRISNHMPWTSSQPDLAHSYSAGDTRTTTTITSAATAPAATAAATTAPTKGQGVKSLWRDENPIVEGGRSVPIMTSGRLSAAFNHPCNSEDDDDDDDNLTGSIKQMTLERRRPSIANSTSVVNLKRKSLDEDIFAMDDIEVGTTKESPTTTTTTTTTSSLLLPHHHHYHPRPKKPPTPALLQVDSSCLNKSTPNSKLQSPEVADNPWSLQIYNRDLQKMRNNVDNNNNNNNVQKYILIEDLTDGVKYPCVLDLKMGTRQYGVYATREKMRSQTVKCEKSTSKILGVRVCGMQVYNTHAEEFTFQDKYYGRTLKPETFRDTLQAYLDNGQGCQIQHIPVIVRKLRRLARIVKTMSDYRFYASSLLMIYDGDPHSTRKIDVRIIDFANCVTAEDVRYRYDEFTYPPRNKSPDNGYLLGLKTLVLCFEWIFKHNGGSPDELAIEGDDVFADIFESANEHVLSSILS